MTGDPKKNRPAFKVRTGGGPRVGSIEEYISSLKASPRFGPQVVHHERLAGQGPKFKAPAGAWHGGLEQALDGQGFTRLYSHQASAIDLIRQGKNTIVATPTASGKSLIYNLPVFEKILADPEAGALYIFPLKALAQDQLRAIEGLAACLPEEQRPSAAICDGDTPPSRRRKLRDAPPRILISNPDMLHLSLLAYHEIWARFWSGLTHVILDEVHTYRGIFGSHMAWVLRRLHRICRFYGTDPLFILSSATIGNPRELAENLLGRPAEVIDNSGAPRGARHFIFLDPYNSAVYTASQLLEAALKRGLRSIVYTQSRKTTELIFAWTRSRLGPLADRLTSYRAGYLPEERRKIEAGLAAGDLLGVVSTSALELGIDIGDLDLCILVGYPGTVMATWQRSGRVGRRQRESLVVLIGQEDALDKHFMQHPGDFFSRDLETAVLNPENPEIMKRHLLCVAAETPLAVDDPLLNNNAAREAVSALADTGALLLGAGGRRWFCGRKNPHRRVDLRGSGRSFVIRGNLDRKVLGEIDGIRCWKECHPGAVYLHRGRTWLVDELDIDAHEVRVSRRRTNYFTRPQCSKRTEILKTFQTVSLLNFKASLGYLRVTETVTGFQRRLVKGQKLIGADTLDLPPLIFETEGLWLEIPDAVRAAIEQARLHFMGGIHALEHAAISIFPLLVLCDRNDVGGISMPEHPQLPAAAVFIYDGYPGGVGLSRQAYKRVEDLLRFTQNTISACSCESGCPSCVHSPKCGSGNRPIDKEAAGRILTGMLTPAKRRKHVKGAAGEGGPKKGGEPGRTGVARWEKIPLPPAAGEHNKTAEREARPPERYGVFDIETQRSAAEVGGWQRADRMGISAAVLYDSKLDEFLTFLEDDIPALVRHLRKLDLVVGFNNKRFDNQVLSAYTSFDLYSLPTLDLLEEVTRHLGYRLSLDRLAEHTLGHKKSANGLLALKWYREGRIDEIVRYCRQDVSITRDLFLFGLRHRHLLFKNKAGNIVRCRVRFDNPGW